MLTLLEYANPPTNYIGTTLFLSYIGLALYATLSTTYILYNQYTSIFQSPRSKQRPENEAVRNARLRHIKIYAFLASLSFALLSYHMLLFLVAHYSAWSNGAQHAYGNKTENAGVSKMLWKWMLESSLFQDFAADLVGDGPSALGTQGAVLGMWFWNVWIGGKARERKWPSKTMLPYILLSQILPTSFLSTLFIIRLHISSPDLLPPPATPAPTSTSEKPGSSAHPHKPPPSPSKSSPLLPTLLLNLTLLTLPSLRTHPLFIPLMLFSRAILLLPHTGLVSLRRAEVSKCLYVSVGFVVAGWMRGRKEMGLVGIWGGNGRYAVKALGWDAVLGVVVAGVVGWGGGV